MIIVRDYTWGATGQPANQHKWLNFGAQCTALALFLAVIAPVIKPTHDAVQPASQVVVGPGTVLANTADDKTGLSSANPSSTDGAKSAIADTNLFIGVYGGAPYTYSSDVHTIRPNGTDFTLHDVDWYGKPFKSPIYYGVRVAKWSEHTPFGAMLDFTHSKAISNRKQEVRRSGKINNKPLSPSGKISETLRKLEFSHGHNMLTMNGLYRLPVKLGQISPYIGVGAGISIPHSEIRFKGDLKRTYEYQYTGPAFQALVGLEFQLPTMSIFLEYKFTFADYQAPLTFRDGAWVTQDLWAQFQDWRAGKAGEGGSLTTKLASHQLIGGFGMRITRTAAAQ